MRVPNFPHNSQILPACMVNRVLQASEKFKEWDTRSSFIPTSYFIYWATGSTISAANGYDQNVINAGSATSITSLATFVFAEDLRKVHNSQILDGVDLSLTANNFLEMNILAAPTNTQSVFFVGLFDIIFEIDMEEGVINYRM
jgi:hypothetical protein